MREYGLVEVVGEETVKMSDLNVYLTKIFAKTHS